MISFDDYYRKYLGLPQGNYKNAINSAERRSKPVAFFYLHHTISTLIDDQLIHSVSPGLVQGFTRNLENHKYDSIGNGLTRSIDDAMFDLLPPFSYTPMLMHRMTLESMDSLSGQGSFSISVLSENSKRLFDKQFSQRGMIFSRFLWDPRIKTIQDGRYFAIIENDEIAATSFISDIDFGAGNIVVSTKPKYRKKGYGKAVASRATEWCFNNRIRPIYLVAVNNTPSVKIAQGLGYETMSKEIVVSGYLRTSV